MEKKPGDYVRFFVLCSPCPPPSNHRKFNTHTVEVVPLKRKEEESLPASVGSVQIKNNFGSIQFGDTANNSPRSITKSISGAGGGNSGNTVNVTIENSSTNTKVIGARGRKRRCPRPRRRPTKRFRKCVRKCLQKRVCCPKKCKR